MMRNSLHIALLLLLVIGGLLSAQTLDALRLKYERFEYQAVVDQARQMLQPEQKLDSASVKQVLLLSAMSNYALQNVDAAMADFQELLRLDAQFEPEATKTSPKIIQFFHEIKRRFPSAERERVIVRIDTVRMIREVGRPMLSALKRSMIWPGWGHCYLADRGKGRLLRGASVLSLTTAIYATLDCREKEKAYLNTTSRWLMDQRYDKFDRAYKMRNVAWGAFAATWLFSQADLLYFHHPALSERMSIKAEPGQISLCWQRPL
jgi:hypothetical protein